MTNTPARPFSDWLRDQSRGKTHDELSEGLRDLVAKVKDTGKKGTITLTVTVEPMPKSDGSALIVTDEIKLKLPEFAREASLFFADDDNNLRRDDPRQLTFESLREVPPPPGVDPFTGAHQEPSPILYLDGEMGELDVKLAKQVVELLKNTDADFARQIQAQDARVDELHRHVFDVVLGEDWKENAMFTVDVTLASRYHERFADHVVDISTKVSYLTTGDWAETE